MALSFEVSYEDDDLIAVVKPSGVVVHSTRETGDDAISVVRRQTGRDVFAYHRLDKGTSGILLLGKRRLHAAKMTRAFEKKLVRKAYLAVVEGVWDQRINKIDAKLEKTERGPVVVSENGKPSLTTFRVLARGGSEKTLIEALPKTGRTHQIRVHCAHAGHPILGDTLYGRRRGGELGFALHAHELAFPHPASGERIVIRDLPETWRDTWLSGLDVTDVWARLAKS